MCFTTLGEILKWIFEMSFRGVSFSSKMWRGHLISYTNHDADLLLWMHNPRIYNPTKNHLGSAVKHLHGYCNITHGGMTLFIWWHHQMETLSALLTLVNFPHKGQRRGALVFSLICAWINGWVNNDKANDLRRHRAHYNVIVITRHCCSASILINFHSWCR